MGKITVPLEIEVISSLDLSKFEIKILITEKNKKEEDKLLKIREYLKDSFFLTENITPRYYGFKNPEKHKRYIVILENLKNKLKISIDKTYCKTEGKTNSRFKTMNCFILDTSEAIVFLKKNLIN